MHRFINKYIIAILGFYIFWLGILPLVLSKGVGILCKNISHNSKYEVVISKPTIKTSITPILNLSSEKFAIKNPKNKNSIEIGNLKLKIRLLPLFSGRIHINDLSIENLDLEAEIKKDLYFNKNFFNNLSKTKIVIDSISVDNYKTLFYKNDIKEPINYSGKNFLIQRKNSYVKFKLDGSFIANNKKSQSKINVFIPKNNDLKKTIFDVDVKNFDISPLRIYFKEFLPQDIVDLTGFISVHANKGELHTELKNFGVYYKDSVKDILFPEKMDIKSKFGIKRQVIDLENVDIGSKNIHIVLDGKILDYFGKSKPSIDLNIRIDKSKVEDIVNLLPALKFEEIDIYKLKKYKLYGNLLSNFSIKGRLPEPDVNGDIYINDVVLIKPIPNAKGATIKLKMNGRYADFDVVVPASTTQKVFVKGSQELYNIKFADFIVKSTDSVDLKIAQRVVNPLHEILNFVVGPLPIMDLAGKGNIDILVKGNRKNPHIWGQLIARDATAKFLDIPEMALEKANVKLVFNDTNVAFANNTGVMNGKETKINGICDLYGKFDFDIKANEQPTKKLYSSIKNSEILKSLQIMVPDLDKITGNANIDIKVYGAVKALADISFNTNTFAKGVVSFADNSFTLQNITVEKTNGNVDFASDYADAIITAQIGNSPLDIQAKIKNGTGDVSLKIPKLNPNYLINDTELKSKQYLPIVSLEGKYKGNIDNIDFNKLNLKSKIISSASDNIFYKSGDINLSNGNIQIKNLQGFIKHPQNTFKIDLKATNLLEDKRNFNGQAKLIIPDLTLLNDILASDVLPTKIRNHTKKYEFLEGNLDLDLRVFNNYINAQTDLSGIKFIYVPIDLPINIINGNLIVRNNLLRLNKINMLADKMPILLDGDIRDILGKQVFNLYLNSKPQQEFIDKYINNNQIYPIKIKGDIVYWTRFKGVKDNYELKSNIDLSRDASIYHFGATVGDIENAIEVDLDSKIVDGKILRIKEFSYDKVIDSQSGKQTRLNLLKANGGIKLLKDDIEFDDLKIKTTNPTDARIFNIIFRKPNIKQGQFTSDLKLNGKLTNPKVLGDFHIFETNIPFFDTTMKNIELVFKDKIVEVSSKGEVMGNDVSIEGVLKNKLSAPYHLEKGTFYTKNLDLNRIVEKLKLSEVDDVSTFESFEGFKLSSITFDNLKFKADNIELRNIRATDYEATTSLDKNGIFNIDKFVFNIAQGELNGKYKYNLKNNDMSLGLVANNINANDISWALFDLKNQIYGDMTGKINLSCNGTNFQSCMQTLNGSTTFNVKDGNMPKLGSLEYLLKASNLVKGGFTGISINSVIDLISPLKLGQFTDIYGNVLIEDGLTKTLEITTKGDDLSLFMDGKYNFATSVADMQVLGLLSRKISNLLGPIGNVSINTLFNVIPGINLEKDSPNLERINKIPGIELSNKAYRKFVADIKGNINGDDYVTSFKWIN